MEKIGELKLPLPSLIILKNSITEGSIPKPSDLEIGEVALTLAGGEEGIWVKNSEGKVLNLRRPDKTLFWGDIFKIFPNRVIFEKELEEGNISSDSICFITDEKQIWTNGKYYASDYDPEDLEKIVAQRLLTIPESVFLLDPNTITEGDVEKAWEGIDNFKTIAIAATNNSVLAALRVPGGTIPVSIISDIKSIDDITVSLEWISNGYYYNETYLLKDGEITFQRYLKSPLEANAEVENIKTRLDSVEENLCWIEAN